MKDLNEFQIDAIQEMINIGVGKAASLLNSILNKHVELSIPSIKLMSSDLLVKEINEAAVGKVSCVDLHFKGNINGYSKLFFPSESVSQLVSIFAPDEDLDDQYDELLLGTLVEIGNIVLNSLIGSLSNQLKIDLVYSTPQYIEFADKNSENSYFDTDNHSFIHARTQFKINDLDINGSFVLFLEIESLDYFITYIDKMIESY